MFVQMVTWDRLRENRIGAFHGENPQCRFGDSVKREPHSPPCRPCSTRIALLSAPSGLVTLDPDTSTKDGVHQISSCEVYDQINNSDFLLPFVMRPRYSASVVSSTFSHE